MAHITFGRNEEDDYFNPSSYGVNSGTRTEGEAVCSRLSGGLNGYDSTLQTERTERVNTLSHILQGHQTAAFSSGPMCPLPAADPSLHVDFQMSDFERSLNQPDHPELPSGKQMLLARADVMVMEGSSLFETPRPRAATVPPQVENSGRSSTLPELELSFSGTFGGLPTESVVQTYKHVANLHRLQRVERDVEDNRCNAEPGPVVTAARAQDAFQRVINHAQAVQGGDGVYRFPRWGAPKEAQKLAAGSKYPVELRSFGAEGLSGLMTVTNVVGYPLRVLGDAIASGASGVCTVFDVKTQCAAAQHSVASALHTVGDYVIPDRLVELGRSTVVSFEDMGIARGHTQATGGDLLNIGLVLVGGGVTKQVTKMGRTGATGNGVALAAPPLVEESGAVTLFTATDKIKLAARTHQRAVSAEVVRAKTQVGQALMPKNLPQTFGEFFSKAGRVQLEKVYVQGVCQWAGSHITN